MKMIPISKKSKVYICSPYHNTGGPKSLHQLASKLSAIIPNVYIVYEYEGKFCDKKSPLYDFPGLKIASKDEISDSPNNVIIVPEASTSLLNRLQRIQKVIWWLSKDYYQKRNLWEISKEYAEDKKISLALTPLIFFGKLIKHPELKKMIKRAEVVRREDFPSLYHLYNCEYVREFLVSNNVPESRMQYLCGPLEKNFLHLKYADIKGFKQKYVTYNPAKIDEGFLLKVKKYLRTKNVDIKFVPIKNMTRKQVFDTLRGAKLYIDFGTFPGPERMPREAVSLYCNIITSKKGSAANNVDVPIPRENKFDLTDENVPKVGQLMLQMIENYEDYVSQGDQYREKVYDQIESFDQRIANIFDIK